MNSMRLLLVLVLGTADAAVVALSLTHGVNMVALATRARHSSRIEMTATEPAADSVTPLSSAEPLLLRAARGEKVERSPVWMMRQAGRHMAAYRALVSKYPTFRERSEIPEVCQITPCMCSQPATATRRSMAHAGVAGGFLATVARVWCRWRHPFQRHPYTASCHGSGLQHQ